MPARIWRCSYSQVDFEAEELVGLGDALGDLDLRDAELDLGEVVDGDFFGGDLVGGRSSRRSRSRCIGGDGRRCCLFSCGNGESSCFNWRGRGDGFGRPWRRWARPRGGSGGVIVLFDLLHTGDWSFVCAGEDGAERAEFCAGFQAAPFSSSGRRCLRYRRGQAEPRRRRSRRA